MAQFQATGGKSTDDGFLPYDKIVTGHFHSTAGYQVTRSKGRDDWLLIYTVDGIGQFNNNLNESALVFPGQLVLIKPGTPQGYGVEASRQYWEILWAHFQLKPQWMEWVNWPQLFRGVLHTTLPTPPEQNRVKNLLLDMNKTSALSARNAQDIALSIVEQVLLWCDQVHTRSGESAIDPRIRLAIDFASTHLSHELDVDTLADKAGLSTSRFAHLFRQEMGQSPQRYVEQLRIKRARQLLERAGLSIKEVSAQVGFADAFYFANRFRKTTGQSPTAYRQQHVM
jgi:AraC family transcriptional regulator, arabinose operon regulatory protein